MTQSLDNNPTPEQLIAAGAKPSPKESQPEPTFEAPTHEQEVQPA